MDYGDNKCIVTVQQEYKKYCVTIVEVLRKSVEVLSNLRTGNAILSHPSSSFSISVEKNPVQGQTESINGGA